VNQQLKTPEKPLHDCTQGIVRYCTLSAVGVCVAFREHCNVMGRPSKKFLIWMIDRGGEFACDAAWEAAYEALLGAACEAACGAACASKERRQILGQ
jgi:hypothetical protein